MHQNEIMKIYQINIIKIHQLGNPNLLLSNFDWEVKFSLYTKFGFPRLHLTGFEIMKIYQINIIKIHQNEGGSGNPNFLLPNFDLEVKFSLYTKFGVPRLHLTGLKV